MAQSVSVCLQVRSLSGILGSKELLASTSYLELVDLEHQEMRVVITRNECGWGRPRVTSHQYGQV